MQTLTRLSNEVEVSAGELACAQLALPADPERRAMVVAGLRRMRTEIERRIAESEVQW